MFMRLIQDTIGDRGVRLRPHPSSNTRSTKGWAMATVPQCVRKNQKYFANSLEAWLTIEPPFSRQTAWRSWGFPFSQSKETISPSIGLQTVLYIWWPRITLLGQARHYPPCQIFRRILWHLAWKETCIIGRSTWLDSNCTRICGCGQTHPIY